MAIATGQRTIDISENLADRLDLYSSDQYHDRAQAELQQLAREKPQKLLLS